MKIAQPLAEDLPCLDTQLLDYTREQIRVANLYELLDFF